jgi:hypothetical protein
MQPSVRILVVEWVLAAILITVTVPSEKGGKGYSEMMSTMMLRLSGLTGIFFALALIGTSQRAAKFSIYFGFIIDLGILYHAATSGSGTALSGIFTGKSILSSGEGSGGVVLAADFQDKSEPPQPSPFGGAPVVGTIGASGGSGSFGSAPLGGSSGGMSNGSGGAQLSPNYPGGPGSTIPTPGIPGIPA